MADGRDVDPPKESVRIAGGFGAGYVEAGSDLAATKVSVHDSRCRPAVDRR